MPNHPLLAASMLLLLTTASSVTLAREANLRAGKDINETCAGCHGEFGQGGKAGEYPRIAGLPVQYLDKQMRLFRARHRPNMPMVEYVDERQAPDEDIADVSAYLASIKLETKLPPLKPGESVDGYSRLMLTKMMINIARAEGDPAKGERTYNKECRTCHGEQGWGKSEKGAPMMAGQYTNYLWRQIELFRTAKRIHDDTDPGDKMLKEMKDQELQDIFAYLSLVDD